MEFNYDIINKITNEDYKSRSRELHDSCKEIERKYMSKDYRGCCLDVRRESEAILRYIYERVMHTKRIHMSGKILEDVKFRAIVQDVDFLKAAEDLQRIGNKYAHKRVYEKETKEEYDKRMKLEELELPRYTEDILKYFSVVLYRGINFINEKIFEKQGELKIKFNIRTNMYTNLEEKILEADLNGVVSRSDYKYVWYIEGEDRPHRNGGRTLKIIQKMQDKIIKLEAIKGKNEHVLSSSYGPIKASEINLMSNKKIYTSEKEILPFNAVESTFEIGKEEKYFTAVEPIFEIGKEEKTLRAVKDILSNFSENFGKTATGEEVGEPKFHCFDSNVSRLHYFIAPREEYYVTNSLEFVDFHKFLNELLKDQGYQNVIIVSHISENDSDNFPVIAYDRMSELSFDYPIKLVQFFENNKSETENKIQEFCNQIDKQQSIEDKDPIRVGMGGRRKPDKGAAVQRPYFGKRIIRTISLRETKEEKRVTFPYFLNNYVIPALKQEYIKTAIVFPIELLVERQHIDGAILTNLRNQINKVGENIVIITANQESMLSRLFENEKYKDVEKEIFNACDEIEKSGEPISRSKAIIDALSVIENGGSESKKVRVLIADTRPGKDEIANLLMLKKQEEEENYQNLSYSKIYSLAEYLYTKCYDSEHTQEEFPELNKNNTWNVTSMALFENNLNKQMVREALIAKSRECFERKILKCKDWSPTCIERIYTKIDVVPWKKDRKIAYSGQEVIDRDLMTQFEREAMKKNATLKLDKLIGLKPVKETLERILSAAANPLAFKAQVGPGHYIFSGNPGTGKTTVARLVGEILRSEGLLRRGHLVEVKKADLVSQNVGETPIKAMGKFEEALDGVLLFDEAYELINEDAVSESKFKSSFDEEAYTALLKFMEDNRHRVCVICAGYKNGMEKFLDANPGMRDRFTETIDFPDYNESELFEILKHILKETTALTPTDEYLEKSKIILANMPNEAASEFKQFANARSVRLYVEESIKQATYRAHDTQIIDAEDIPEKYKEIDLGALKMRELQNIAWEKLDKLIGLKEIKDLLRARIEHASRAGGRNKVPGHYVFAGNPGTGKTEVARLMADILYANGLLRTNKTIEIKPADVIGTHVGEAESLTLKKCQEALDGVLFIDEAYTLVNVSDNSINGKFSSSYAEKVYEEIMKFMENHRQRICVIFAGYKKEMNIFLDANPGMRSRVSAVNIIEFSDFSDDDLIEIMALMITKNEKFHIVLNEDFKKATRKIFPTMRKEKNFGNARAIRAFLERCELAAVARIPETDRIVLDDGLEQLTFCVDDIPKEYFTENNEHDEK